MKYLGFNVPATCKVFVRFKSATDASVMHHFSLNLPQIFLFCGLACKATDANHWKKILVKWFDWDKKKTEVKRHSRATPAAVPLFFFFSTWAVLGQAIKAYFPWRAAKGQTEASGRRLRRRRGAGPAPEVAAPARPEGGRRQRPSPQAGLPPSSSPTLLEARPVPAQGATRTGTESEVPPPGHRGKKQGSRAIERIKFSSYKTVSGSFPVLEFTSQASRCLSQSTSLSSPRADGWVSSTAGGWGSTAVGTRPRAKLLAALLQRHLPPNVPDPSANQRSSGAVDRMTLHPFITSMLSLVCPSQTVACYGQDEGLLECTRLPRGAGSAPTLQCWPSASWNSRPRTRYTPKSHGALVLPQVGHNLSWAKPPLFNERLVWVTTTSQVRKGWGAGRGTSKHDLEALPVLDNCSQAVQSLPWVRAQLFYVQDETSPGRSLQVVRWEAAARAKPESMWFQQLLDNTRWCAWGGKPECFIYATLSAAQR